MILFWQFTIKTLEELDIVSNQNLSIEMFLIRLMHISSLKPKDESADIDLSESKKEKIKVPNIKTDTINQIKNITQEIKAKPDAQTSIEVKNINSINSFDELLNFCSEKKEMKLKYELEKNVNLVSFEKNRVEISFNDSLDKNFVKDLSLRLLEWTGQRWIITFSKTKGEISVKEKEQNQKTELLKRSKETELYKNVLEKFPDAKLINVMLKNKKDE